MRKNRGIKSNENLISYIQEEIGLNQRAEKFRINPFIDFFEKREDDYLTKNRMFNQEIIFNGIIQDFDGWRNLIERVGEFGYNQKKFNEDLFSNTPVVLTQSAINTEYLFEQNEKIIETMFETYKTPYLLLMSQASLNIMGNNKLNGFVVDMGESGTQFTSVIEGFTQYHDSYFNTMLSGRNLNILHYYEKMRNSLSKNENIEDFEISYVDYMKSKKMREEESNELFNSHDNFNYCIKSYNLYDCLYFFPKIYRNFLYTKNNPMNFDSFDKPVFLLDFLQRNHLNNKFANYNNLLREEIFNDYKLLCKINENNEKNIDSRSDVNKNNKL
jgi:hypothetical protein